MSFKKSEFSLDWRFLDRELTMHDVFQPEWKVCTEESFNSDGPNGPHRPTVIPSGIIDWGVANLKEGQVLMGPIHRDNYPGRFQVAKYQGSRDVVATVDDSKFTTFTLSETRIQAWDPSYADSVAVYRPYLNKTKDRIWRLVSEVRRIQHRHDELLPVYLADAVIQFDRMFGSIGSTIPTKEQNGGLLPVRKGWWRAAVYPHFPEGYSDKEFTPQHEYHALRDLHNRMVNEYEKHQRVHCQGGPGCPFIWTEVRQYIMRASLTILGDVRRVGNGLS
jgi:hypothetical protein